MLFHSRLWKSGSISLLCLPLILTGCTSKTEEPENVIIVEKEAESVDYNLTVASLGDVTKTEKIKCTYTQLNEQEVSFPVSGRRVSRVYVEKDDSVKKGDLLAELSTDGLESQIENLEYKIARNSLLLSQLYETQERNIERIKLQNPAPENVSDYELQLYQEELDEKIQELKESNRYSIEDYQDAISLDSTELEGLKTDLNNSYVYASSSGIIADIKKNLEGSTSVAGETILRILDDSECIFSVSDMTYKEYFMNDAAVSMSIIYGKGSGQYQLLPYHYENWTDSIRFTILEQPDGATLEVGDIGSIELVLESRTNVLCLPNSAIHTADGQEYVYILNDENVREVKWIETGLHGDSSIEITGNLEEGDKVFLR